MNEKQQDSFRARLTDAIIKLCQTEAVYTSELRIEGTVCVVSDHAAVMIAHFSECVGNSYSLDSERNDNLESGFERLVDGLSVVDQTESMLPEVKMEHVLPDEFEGISEDRDSLSVMHGFCEAAKKVTCANNNEADDVKQSAGGQQQCPHCQKMFKLKHTLQSHVRKHHGHQLQMCYHCSATFTTQATLHVHIRREHSDLRKCRQSGKKLSLRPGMQHHADNHCDVPQTAQQVAVDEHDTCLNGYISVPEAETSHDCMEADGADSLALLEALEQKDWEKMIANTEFLVKSMNTGSYQTPLQPSEIYKCTTPDTHCSGSNKHSNVIKTTVMQYFEKVNVETSHGLYKYKCCLCHKMFKLRTSLYGHVNSHTGNRRYACNTCGNRFVHHSSLHNHINNKHMLQRQDMLRYLCTGCDRRFKFRSQYERHLRSFPGHCTRTPDAQ